MNLNRFIAGCYVKTISSNEPEYFYDWFDIIRLIYFDHEIFKFCLKVDIRNSIVKDHLYHICSKNMNKEFENMNPCKKLLEIL